jgi:hypothetical protein
MSDPAPKKPAKSNNPGTVFDVKRPGKATAQGTSRPVIVGHRSIVRDPITTGKTDKLSPAREKPDIRPLTLTDAKPTSDSKSAAPQADTAATPELAAVAKELAWQPQPEEKKDAPAAESKPELKEAAAPAAPQSEPAASKDFVPGSTAPILPPEPVKKQIPLTPELKKEMEEEVKKNPTAPEPQGVVVSGDHGPIDFVKVLLWFVSVIVLVIVVGDVLLDAGVITTSVSIPHTHFIK